MKKDIIFGNHSNQRGNMSSPLHIRMYVCMYIYLGLRARQHLRSLAPVMKWWWMIMMAKWYSGTLWASWHTSYRWGKTPKKPHPGNLSRPGIEPGPAAWQARMLPLVPQRWTTRLKPTDFEEMETSGPSLFSLFRSLKNSLEEDLRVMQRELWRRARFLRS